MYNKSSSHVIRFVDLNDAYDKLRHLERISKETHVSIATHFFAQMVGGFFTGFHFPIAHFQTQDVTGNELLFIENIERLE